MLDLSEAKKLMHERDCSSLIGRPEDKMYMYLGLADQVPGLVGEIELLREYVALLGKELAETAIISHTHGWRTSRFEEGKALRKKLGMQMVYEKP